MTINRPILIFEHISILSGFPASFIQSSCYNLPSPLQGDRCCRIPVICSAWHLSRCRPQRFSRNEDFFFFFFCSPTQMQTICGSGSVPRRSFHLSAHLLHRASGTTLPCELINMQNRDAKRSKRRLYISISPPHPKRRPRVFCRVRSS